MFGLVKLSALSAVLSFGVVTVFAPASPSAEAAPAGKPFQGRIAASDGAAPLRAASGQQTAGDFNSPIPARIAKGDRLRTLPNHCAGQTWPYVSSDCIADRDGRPMPTMRLHTLRF